jgi:CHASE3 domain sensor protein
MNWTFGKRLAIGFMIAVAAVVAIGATGYRSTQELLAHTDKVEHTHQVRQRLIEVVSHIRNLEGTARGYALSGDEAFLEPASGSPAAVNRLLSELLELTADNPAQQRRLNELRPLAEDRVKHSQRVIDVRRAEGAAAAHALVSAGQGRDLMESLVRVSGEIDAEELRLLRQRQADAEHGALAVQRTISWGSLLAALLVSGVGWYIARTLSAQIGSAVRHIQSSSTELQAAANQQATSAKEQATAMSEISTTISELMATSRQIAESARRVSEISDRTASASRAGDVNVKRGSDAMSAIRRQVDAVVTNMLELGKKSQRIGAVLDIVSELAEQTNILAINATIEAAGAGEAGKRFGIVADEIRKLADRVAGSAKEIRALIDEVQRATNTTVMTTETGSKAVESGSDQFSKVAQSFGEIGSEISTATQAAKEIELSTKQQSTAVEQVNVAITSVAQASKETEVSTSQTLKTASELSNLSWQLLRIVQPDSSGASARAGA